MLLVTGKYLWTGRELLSDAAVLCDGDKIREVGGRAALEAAWPEVRRVGGPNLVLMPGLISGCEVSWRSRSWQEKLTYLKWCGIITEAGTAEEGARALCEAHALQHVSHSLVSRSWVICNSRETLAASQ